MICLIEEIKTNLIFIFQSIEIENKASCSSSAECRTGKTLSSEHAQTSGAYDNQNKQFHDFLKRGEDILDTFTQSIRGFEAQTLQMKQLSASVTSIQTQLKRKADEDEPLAQCGKKVRATNEISSDSDGKSDISEDEIDCLLMNDDRIPHVLTN